MSMFYMCNDWFFVYDYLLYDWYWYMNLLDMMMMDSVNMVRYMNHYMLTENRNVFFEKCEVK